MPDLVGPGLRLLFVGINPGLWTAATQTHFAHPGNRFYPALRLAGIVDRELDRAGGMTEDDRDYLVGRGIGITNLVNRASVRADELSRAELRAGSERLTAFVAEHRPRVIAVAGVTAYRTAFARPEGERRSTAGAAGGRRAVGGAQPEWPQCSRDHQFPRRRVRRAGSGRRCAGLTLGPDPGSTPIVAPSESAGRGRARRPEPR